MLRICIAINDIGDTFPVAKLAKHHTYELVPATEILDLIIAPVAVNAFIELVPFYKRSKLGQYIFTCVHMG